MLQKVNKEIKVLKILNIFAEEHIVRKFARKDKALNYGNGSIARQITIYDRSNFE